MKVFVTSDTHFYHFNIIKYCNRPFNNIDEMNSELIKRWNETVSDEDIVIFCGDFCFARTAEAAEVTERLTRALKGHKIIVKGNHDFKKFCYTNVGWDNECYQELIFNNRFSFRHRPDNPYSTLLSDAEKFDFIFYGHVHDKVLGWAPINCINVCVDVNDFRPLDITNYFTPDELISIQKLIKMD